MPEPQNPTTGQDPSNVKIVDQPTVHDSSPSLRTYPPKDDDGNNNVITVHGFENKERFS